MPAQQTSEAVRRECPAAAARAVRSVFCVGPAPAADLERELAEHAAAHAPAPLCAVPLPAALTRVFPPAAAGTLPRGVALFCHPDGCTLAPRPRAPAVFAFAVPAHDHTDQRHCTCLVHDVALPAPVARALARTHAAATRDSASSASAGSGSGTAAPATLYFPHCVCVETATPCHAFARQWLLCLHEHVLRPATACPTADVDAAAATMLAHLLWAVPTPSVHRPLRFSITTADTSTASTTGTTARAATECEVPCEGLGGVRAGDAALAGVLRGVPAAHLVALVGALLAERRVVLVATDRARLAPAAAALRTLLAPLQWTGVCVPVLPRRLAACLAAPAPWLLGCTRATLAAALRAGFLSQQPQQQLPPLVYDLDNTAPVLLAASAGAGAATGTHGDAALLPGDVAETLHADLARVCGSSAASDALAWDPWRPARCAVAPAAFARGVRTAFLRATTRVLAGAQRHLLHVRREPAPRALFNVERAVDAHAPRDRAFYAALYRTGHFAHFCRTLAGGGDSNNSGSSAQGRLFAAAVRARLWAVPFDDAVRCVEALLDRHTAAPRVLPACVLPPPSATKTTETKNSDGDESESDSENSEGCLENLDWDRVVDTAQQYPCCTSSSNSDDSDGDNNSTDDSNDDINDMDSEAPETGEGAVAYTEEEERLAHWFVALLADDRHAVSTAADLALLQQVVALVATRAGRKALLAAHAAYRAAHRPGVVLAPPYFALLADVVRCAMDAAFRERDFLTAAGLCTLAAGYSRLPSSTTPASQQEHEPLLVADTLATLDVWNSALFWETRTVLALDAELRAHYHGSSHGTAATGAATAPAPALEGTRAAEAARTEGALVAGVAERTCAAMLASGVSDAAAARWVCDVAALADLDVSVQRALRQRIGTRAACPAHTRDAPDATAFESLTREAPERTGTAGTDTDARPTLLVPVCGGGAAGAGTGGRGQAWRVLLQDVLTAAPRDVVPAAQQLARALAPQTACRGPACARVHAAPYTRAHIVEKVCRQPPGTATPPSPVLCVAALSGHVACGTAAGAVTLWRAADCTRGAAATVAHAHAGSVAALAACAPADALVSGGADRTAVVWAAARLEKVRTLRAHAGAVAAVCAAARAPLVLTAGADGRACVWDLRARTPALVLRAHRAPATAAALAADTLVLTGARDGTVRFCDLRAPTAPVLCTAHRDWVSAVLFASGGNNSTNSTGGQYTPLSAALDGEVVAWDVRRGVAARRLAAHTGAVTALAAATGGAGGADALATAGADATLRVWDRAALAQRRCLVGHAGAVTALVPLRGGRLATGGADGTVRVWDPRTASARPPCRATLAAHGARVAALCAVSEGAFASASWDGSVRLWELEQDF